MFRIYHIISFTLIKKYFAMSCCGVKIVTVSIERHSHNPKECDGRGTVVLQWPRDHIVTSPLRSQCKAPQTRLPSYFCTFRIWMCFNCEWIHKHGQKWLNLTYDNRMTWCFSPCLHLLHLPLPWLPFSLPLLLLPPFSYLCTTPSSLTSCFVLFLILSFLLLFLSPLSTPFFYLLCHPLWVVWLLFCCLLISRPDPSFPARSFLFLLPLFSTLLSAFSSCTALPIRCIVSFGLLVSGCGSQSDWVSACWASFSSLCSLTQHKAKVSITAILLSTQESTIPVHHTGPKQSFLYTARQA